MNIRSLGYRTDLFFPRFDGEVLDRGDYVVVRTPANPDYHWGNFLLFSRPPAAGDRERWPRLFAQEIGAPPTVTHLAFGWDGVDGGAGDVQPFLDAGFGLSTSVVLTARTVGPPPKYDPALAVRPLREDWEWEGALQNQIACRAPEYALSDYAPYKTRQMRRYRAMARAGLGAWFGAFLGSEVAGDLGVFVRDSVGRFQSVGTHPDFRRRGVCGTLVFEAARHALARLGAETLVMVADEDSFAAKSYKSVGFSPAERQVGLDWWPRAA